MNWPYICVDVGNREFHDVLIVDRLPEIGDTRYSQIMLQASLVKNVEPFVLPPQRPLQSYEDPECNANLYEFFKVTYIPLNLVTDHVKLIAKRKRKQDSAPLLSN